MAKDKYRESPVGEFIHPWLNRPDTKYNVSGLYKTEVAMLAGESLDAFKADIDATAQAAFDELTSDMAAKEKKGWQVYHPYNEETDADDKPTGRLIAEFRQNAVLKVEGKDKPIKIGLYDADGKAVDVNIFPGTIGCIWYRPRAIKIASLKKAGVRLDFLKVQIIKLAESSGGGGFSKKEGYHGGADEAAAEHVENGPVPDADMPF